MIDVDLSDGSYWTLEWKHHPTKTVVFAKYNKNNIKVCGEGFQGPTDPPPTVVVPNTSLGEWRLVLDCDTVEGAWRSIGLEYAREIWDGLINQGWEVKI